MSDPKMTASNAEARTAGVEILTTSAGATIVTVLGMVLGALVVTRQLNNYLQPYFLPIMALTSVALIGLGVWTFAVIRRDWAAARSEMPRQRVFWLLLVPVLLAVFCAPNPLGSALLNSDSVSGGSGSTTTSANQQASVQQQSRKVGRNPDGTIAYPELSASGPNELTLEDLSNRFTYGSKPQLDGKQVTIIGFASLADDGSWLLGRFKIYCCAADAIAYRVGLEGLSDALTDDAWYSITGTVDTSSPDKVLVRVSSVTPIDQPTTPYL